MHKAYLPDDVIDGISLSQMSVDIYLAFPDSEHLAAFAHNVLGDAECKKVDRSGNSFYYARFVFRRYNFSVFLRVVPDQVPTPNFGDSLSR